MLPPRGSAALFNQNFDLFGHDGRVEGDVSFVAEKQLKGVLSGREFQDGLGLPAAKVPVLVVCRDGDGEIGGEIGVDEKVMMSRACFFDAGRGDPHAL